MKRNPKSKDKTPPPAAPVALALQAKEKSPRSSSSVPADFTTNTDAQLENPVQDEPRTPLEQIHIIQDLDEEPKGVWDYQPPPVPSGQPMNRPGSLKMHEESGQSIAGSESGAKNGEPTSSKPPVPLTRQSELPQEMFRAGKPSTTFSFATPRQSQVAAMEELRKQMAAEDSIQSIHNSFPQRPECSEFVEEVEKVECKDLDPKKYVQQPNDPALITFEPPKECEEVKRRRVSCDTKNDITFGEKEKESVRAVGKELLAMGRRILDEIDLADAFRRSSPPENGRGSGGGSLTGVRKQSSNPKGLIPSDTSINRKSNAVRPAASVSFDLNLPRKDDETGISPEVRGLVMRPSSHDENVQTEKVVELAYANWAEEIQKSKLAFIAAFDQLCYSLGKMGAPVGEEQDGVDEDKLERTSSQPDVRHLKKETTVRRSRPSIVVSGDELSPEESLDENKQSPPGKPGTGSPPMAASNHGAPRASGSRGTRALQVCSSNDSCVDGTEIVSTLKQLTTDVSSLGGKFHELDDQVGVILTSLVAQTEDSKGKMERMEGDLMKLMRLVYEMQCAQKLQMHFGRPSQGDSSEQ